MAGQSHILQFATAAAVCACLFLVSGAGLASVQGGTSSSTTTTTTTTTTTSGNSSASVSSSICYELRTLSRPCVHDVVRCLLEKNMHSEALCAMRHCHAHYPDFVMLGEMLVRESLENTYESRRRRRERTSINNDDEEREVVMVVESEEEASRESSSVLLQRVLLLLRSFEGYEDIIMRVGRRAERSRWPLLFPLAGIPTQLFEGALRREKYDVASSLLVIMDNVEDNVVTKEGEMLPSRVSLQRTLESSNENTQHVLACGRRLIILVEEKHGTDHPLVGHMQSYLERLEMKGRELLSTLRNIE